MGAEGQEEPHTKPGTNMAGGESATGTAEEDFDKYVRPPRDRLEKDSAAFCKFIRYAVRAEKVTQAELVAEALTGSIDRATFSRWLSYGKVPLPSRKDILRYIYDRRMLFADDWSVFLDNVPAPLFHAFIKFCNIKTTSIDNARADVVGTMKDGRSPTGIYALWRYSVDDDEEFVFGKLEFTHSEQTGAIHVDMFQPKQEGKEATQRFRQRAGYERFDGYFFRVANNYVLVLRDVANDDLRVTILDKVRIEHILKRTSVHTYGERRIVQMDGLCLGIDSGSVFVSPVYLELVDDPKALAELDDALDVVPAHDVPKRILKRLRRQPLIRA